MTHISRTLPNNEPKTTPLPIVSYTVWVSCIHTVIDLTYLVKVQDCWKKDIKPCPNCAASYTIKIHEIA